MLKKLKDKRGSLGFNYLLGTLFGFSIFVFFMLAVQIFYIGNRVKGEMRECIFNAVSIQHTATYSGSREYNSISRTIADDDVSGVYGEQTDDGSSTNVKSNDDSSEPSLGGSDETDTDDHDDLESEVDSEDKYVSQVQKSNLDAYINKVYYNGSVRSATAYIDGTFKNDGATWQIKSSAYSIVSAVTEHFGLESYDIGNGFIRGVNNSTPALVNFSHMDNSDEVYHVELTGDDVNYALANFEVYYNDKVNEVDQRPFQIKEAQYAGDDSFTITVNAMLYIPLRIGDMQLGTIKTPIKVKASLEKYFNDEMGNTNLN